MLNKKIVIVGLTLGCVLALAPAARAESPTTPAPASSSSSLFETNFFAVDSRSNPPVTYNSAGGTTISSIESFSESVPCLANTGAAEEKEILAIQNTQPYRAALSNYQAKCGTSSASAPRFIINMSIVTQGTLGKVSVGFAIKNGLVNTDLPLSKKNSSPSCPANNIACVNSNYMESYQGALNNPTCSDPNINASISDVNTGSISNQIVAALNNDANSCGSLINFNNTNQTQQQQALTNIQQLMGLQTPNTTSPAAVSDSQAPSDGIVDNGGLWGVPNQPSASQPNAGVILH